MHYFILAYIPELQAVRGTNNVITLTNHLCPDFWVRLPVGALTNISPSSAGCPTYVRLRVWYSHWREESSQYTREISNISKITVSLRTGQNLTHIPSIMSPIIFPEKYINKKKAWGGQPYNDYSLDTPYFLKGCDAVWSLAGEVSWHL